MILTVRLMEEGVTDVPCRPAPSLTRPRDSPPSVPSSGRSPVLFLCCLILIAMHVTVRSSAVIGAILDLPGYSAPSSLCPSLETVPTLRRPAPIPQTQPSAGRPKNYKKCSSPSAPS